MEYALEDVLNQLRHMLRDNEEGKASTVVRHSKRTNGRTKRWWQAFLRRVCGRLRRGGGGPKWL